MMVVRLAAIVALFLVLGPLTALVTAPAVGQEDGQFLAYWVDSFGPALYTEAQIDQLVADTKAAHLNAIVAQVVRRGDCLCNRAGLPRTEAEVDPSPFDPLQTLIDKAHAAGLEVHAWLNAGIMWGSEVPPVDPSHVFNTHGPSVRGYDNWVMRRYDGATRGANLYFLDLGHPDAADFIVEMFLSIVRNYDVDGIHFDFIRYPDYNLTVNVPAWGYNPVAVERFQAVTGRRDVPVPTDPEWMAWRREQVSNIVRRVYIGAAALKPRVRVSAATITYGPAPEDDVAWLETRAYREVLQDWRGWMEEGLLDLNIPMNYRREQATSETGSPYPMFDSWNQFIKDHQYGRHAAIGTALYLNPVEDSLTQIAKALAPTPAGNPAHGWVGYSYRAPDLLVNQRSQTPEDGRLDLARVLAPAFTPAPVPSMPWKERPATGHLSGALRMAEGSRADQVPVDLYDAATNRLVASRRTDGTGWFGFVDLPPGDYVVSAGQLPMLGTAAATVTIVAGRVTSVSLTLQR